MMSFYYCCCYYYHNCYNHCYHHYCYHFITIAVMVFASFLLNIVKTSFSSINISAATFFQFFLTDLFSKNKKDSYIVFWRDHSGNKAPQIFSVIPYIAIYDSFYLINDLLLLYVLVMSRTRVRVNPHSSLAKWLGVRLRTKFFWFRVQLHLLLPWQFFSRKML